MKRLDLSGKRFGRLVAIEKVCNKGKKVVWKCKCDCGNIVNVLTTNLTCGKTKSCGCFKFESFIKRRTTHNQRHTKLYEVWKSIKQRCFNPQNRDYKNYGGRGISMSEDWKNNFQSFYNWSMSNGYLKSLSIDRIDNNGNYCPENCRWTDRKTQANNTSANRFITFNNETKTLAEWARYYNLSYSCLSSRLSKNWSLERAFLTPTKISRT